MSEKERKRKEEPEDPFDVPEVDEESPPAAFERPKGLLNLRKEGEEALQLKSGSAGGKPAPLVPPAPEGAEVRLEKRQGLSAEELRRLRRDETEADVRRDRPVSGPRPPVPLPPGEFDVRRDAEKRPSRPALQPIEGPVEVVRPQAESKPKAPAPSTLQPGEFQVVVDAHAKNPRSERLKVQKPKKVLGIVDTTFARFDMGEAAAQELRAMGSDVDVVRRTVPGIKDLAVECKILLEEEDCDLVIACGMVGAAPIDKQCAHEASLAIQWAMLATNRHILEVFVHEEEAKDEAQLAWLMDRRTREHAVNAHWMLLEPHRLREQAGRGLRQGFDDAGPVRLS